jgi:hypothetical protein
MEIETSTKTDPQNVASIMNTVLIKCDLCEKNVNVLDTIDLCRETDQRKEEFILCGDCFQKRTDTLREGGWNVDDFIIVETDNTEEDIVDNELGSDFVLTQHLYSADDVRQALATNILLKNKEKTLFWIKELMQSELTDSLITLLWNIYLTYYFALNPEFYNYLLKQTKRMREAQTQAQVQAQVEDGDYQPNTEMMNAVTDIAANLMIRPFTADVLREGMRTDPEQLPIFFGHTDFPDTNIMDSSTVEDIMTAVAGDQIKPTNRKKVSTLFRNLDKLRKNPTKIAGGDVHIPIDIERAARNALIAAYATKQKMGKALFVSPSATETICIPSPCTSADKLLQTHTAISMSEELSFCAHDKPITDGSERIDGASAAMRHAFGQCWEYYAHRAPIWERRIAAHRGAPYDATRKILWDDDELQEQFYETYGYDTDEVGVEVVRRCIAIDMRRLSAEEYCTLLDDMRKKIE